MSTVEGAERGLCIVGAGAAGLWAAAVAARAGVDTLVLEKTPRTGTKVLASGGTRCNLTTTLGPADAARLFRSEGERFLGPAFRALPPQEVRRRFAAWGVPTEEAPLEKVFPRSGRARDVRDALEREARAAGARIELEADVASVVHEGGAWSVRTRAGRGVRARALFLCAGGASYPRTGTSGAGYDWLRALGAPVRAPVPALVPLTSPAAWVRELAGVSWESGELRVACGGRVRATRRRPLLFTHRGLSGPGPMDLSVHVARARGEGAPPAEAEGWSVSVDFFPDVPREELHARLREAAGARGAPRLARLLPEPLPRRLFAALAAAAGLEGTDVRANALARAARHGWVETVKGLAVPVDGTEGFERAEVTSGGLALKVVDPRSMRVNGFPELYVFGELLDIDGPIGGLNFQAAFACAELAGRAVAARINPGRRA